MVVMWDAHKMTFSDGTEIPFSSDSTGERVHIPATRMRSFPIKTLYAGIICLILGGLLIGGLLGFTIGRRTAEAPCHNAVAAIVGPAANYDRDAVNEEITACLGR